MSMFCGEGGIINVKARFKWLILKTESKMTLLKVFGHIFLNNGPILKI